MAANRRYQVRIAAVKAFNKADFAKLEKIGEIETEQVAAKGKTFFRVLMRSDVKGEANTMLQSIKNAGFKDAYIFENKPKALNRHTSGDLSAGFVSGTENSAKYKIRVATVSKLVENQFSNLENLGKIYMDVDHEKGLIRISLGYYQNKQKATEVLNKVKKLGYKDAFIQS